MRYRISWWTPTNIERQWLRRYSSSDTHKCESTGHYCNAMFALGEHEISFDSKGYIISDRGNKPSNDDPRWPNNCDSCGKAFSDSDPYQLFGKQIYVCEATDQRSTLEEAPIGAVWNAWWIADRRKDGPTGSGYMVGPDHRSLVVRLPDNSDWHIDNRASNCTMKDDDTHHCWVRHGRPEDGNLHVDKNGYTCSAGAGSIATPKFHGFLHNNELYDC